MPPTKRFADQLADIPLFRPPKPSPPPPTIPIRSGNARTGIWRFDLTKIAAYCLILSFALTIMAAVQLLVTPTVSTQQLFNLQLGDLQGTVTFEAAGVPDVVIRFENQNISTVTDTAGEYRFDQIRSGDYVVIVEAGGFITERRNITIAPTMFPDLKNIADFELRPGNATITTGEFSPTVIERVHDYLTTCAMLLVVIAVLILMATVCTFIRKRYSLALFGSICGVFAIVYWLLPTILCGAAVLMLILSRRSFR